MSRGRDKFNKYKPVINFLLKLILIFPLRVRIKLFDLFQSTKGIKGVLIRYILLKSIARNVGDNVFIGTNVYFAHVKNLVIGENVSIHPMSYIDAVGELEIGNDVSIAHGVTIMTFNHRYDDVDIPIKDQGYELKSTKIESNVWIGAKASIMAGVTIKSGTVVAANAVVTKDTPTNSVVGGVPAKLIKLRG